MRYLSSLRLATKLEIAFAAVLALTALVGGVAIWQLAQVNDTSMKLSSHWMPGIRVIEDIKSQIARIRTRELQYVISTEQPEMDKYDKVIAKDLDDLHKMQDDYVKLLESPEEKQTYAQLLEMWDRYMASRTWIVSLVLGSVVPGAAGAMLLTRCGIEQVNRAITQMDTVTQQNAGLVQRAAHTGQSLQEQAAAPDAHALNKNGSPRAAVLLARSVRISASLRSSSSACRSRRRTRGCLRPASRSPSRPRSA
jgi:CHASE3 domain sensor protein